MEVEHNREVAYVTCLYDSPSSLNICMGLSAFCFLFPITCVSFDSILWCMTSIICFLSDYWHDGHDHWSHAADWFFSKLMGVYWAVVTIQSLGVWYLTLAILPLAFFLLPRILTLKYRQSCFWCHILWHCTAGCFLRYTWYMIAVQRCVHLSETTCSMDLYTS